MKKGISLITLIITIIVIVILTGTIVFNIINNDVIDTANEAVIRSDMSSLKTELDMYVMEKYLAEEGYEISKLEANNERVIYDGDELEDLTISDVIPSVDNLSYKDNIVILSGEIIYTGTDSKIINILPSKQVEQNITNPEIEIQNLFPDAIFGFDEDVIITIDITDDEEISSVNLTNKIKLYNESNNVVYTDNDSEISISEVTGSLTDKQVTITLNANSISQGGMYRLVVEKGIVKNKYNRYDLVNKEVELYIGDNPPKPLAPTFTSSTDEYTNENILLNITYTEDSVIKKYSLDGGTTWLDYTDPITITGNIVVLAKGINEFGSSSIEAIRDITNIDKSLPTGVFSPNSSNESAQSITVSFNPSDNGTSGVYRWRYSISTDDGNNYDEYNSYIIGDTTSDIILDSNGINKIQVEVEDNAGNIQIITSGSYIIDTEKPIVPTFSQNPETLTNGNVTVIITYPEDAVTKQYSLNSGSTWNNYTSQLTITTNNTTIIARGIDTAGNISTEAIRNITNIDKDPPQVASINLSNENYTNQNITATITSSNTGVSYKYSLDNGVTWLNYTSALSITENKTIKAKCIDLAGNESNETIKVISNIDTGDPGGYVIESNPNYSNNTMTLTFKANDNFVPDGDFEQAQNYLPYSGVVRGYLDFDKNIKHSGNYSLRHTGKELNPNGSGRVDSVTWLHTTSDGIIKNITKAGKYKFSLWAKSNRSNVEANMYLFAINNNNYSFVWPDSSRHVYNRKIYDLNTNWKYYEFEVDITEVGHHLSYRIDNYGTTLPTTIWWDDLKIEEVSGKSPIKRIKLPNGTWVNGDTATYTGSFGSTYNFIVEDQAGNQNTVRHIVSNDRLVRKYTFENIDSNIIKDSSLSKINATMNETPNIVSYENGKYINFNSGNDGFSCNANKYLSNSFSFGAWYKTSETHEIDSQNTTGTGGTSGQKYLFGAAHGGNNAGAGLSVGTNGISVYEHGSGYMPASLVCQSNLGTGWHHVMVVYVNRTPKLYIDGIYIKTGLTSPRAIVNIPCTFGYGPYGSFNGNADDFVIYNKSLSDGEVLSIYNKSKYKYH